MSLATHPSSHHRLAYVSVSDTVGHMPGPQYHDLDVVVSRRGNSYRCEVVEVRGNTQVCVKDHCRRTIVGRGASPLDAFRQVTARAHDVGMDLGLLAAAVSEALEALAASPCLSWLPDLPVSEANESESAYSAYDARSGWSGPERATQEEAAEDARIYNIGGSRGNAVYGVTVRAGDPLVCRGWRGIM